MTFQPYIEFHALPVPVCTDPAVDCNGNGVCASLVSAGCTCDFEDALYMGDDCATLTPYCTTGMCLNGGECNENDGRVYDEDLGTVLNATTCNCSLTTGALSGDMFEGEWCETVPPCDAMPCLNGGVCTGNFGDNTYECDCSDTTSPQSANPFTGPHCEISGTTPCDLTPCQNSGECTDTGAGGSFTCDCVNGWLGSVCSIPPVDYCYSEFCGPHGHCIAASSESSNFTRCICVDGWSGLKCDVEPAICQDKCQNGGLCIHDAFLVTGESEAYACLCPTPWVGTHCQWNETQWSAAPSTSFGLFSALALAVFALLF